MNEEEIQGLIETKTKLKKQIALIDQIIDEYRLFRLNEKTKRDC